MGQLPIITRADRMTYENLNAVISRACICNYLTSAIVYSGYSGD